MSISEEVIKDLLPLYAANECGAESRRLVEEYLRTHPDAAAAVADATRAVLRGPLPASSVRDNESQALKRTQRLLRLRTYVVSLAIFFTLMPLSFTFENGEIHWLLAGQPHHATAYAAIGVVLWIVYLFTRHRLRHSW